jgi:hypothetical protein
MDAFNDYSMQIRRALRVLATAAVLLLASSPVLADGLAPGQFHWTPEASPSGPVVIVVSLPEQRAHVYRDGTRIGVSTISSGKPGHETPTGVYEILQKRRDHRSNLYDNAPMPFMQRLTWDGIALHAGRIPGKPASHGCVRLPHAFARELYEITERGMTVVVADEYTYGPEVLSPGELVPVNYVTGEALRVPGDMSQGVVARSTPHERAETDVVAAN